MNDKGFVLETGLKLYQGGYTCSEVVWQCPGPVLTASYQSYNFYNPVERKVVLVLKCYAHVHVSPHNPLVFHFYKQAAMHLLACCIVDQSFLIPLKNFENSSQSLRNLHIADTNIVHLQTPFLCLLF